MVDGEREFEGHGRRVHVWDCVTRGWKAHRQTAAKSPESFGILIGTVSTDRAEVWIEALTTPKRLDRRWRLGFEMRDPRHEQVVRRMFERSGRQRIYLGTWHTHPEPVPAPSRMDKRDWVKCVRANLGRPLVFVVVGTSETRLFVWAKLGFKSLEWKPER